MNTDEWRAVFARLAELADEGALRVEDEYCVNVTPSFAGFASLVRREAAVGVPPACGKSYATRRGIVSAVYADCGRGIGHDGECGPGGES